MNDPVPDTPPAPVPGADFRAGYVTIIGEPNVGKSTLMNALVGQKLSIVSRKPQTTRRPVLGILSGPSHQIILLDTPGIIRPSYLLQEVMMQFASSAMQDADLLLFMIDATDARTGSDLAHAEAFSRLAALRKPVFLIINKVDRVSKPALLPVIDFYRSAYPFEEIIPLSALRAEGTDLLTPLMAARLPLHPPYYPMDIVSEQPERFFAAEIIRERIFHLLREEIPYASTVEVLEFLERSAGILYLRAEISVERDTQKAILIGKGGTTIKKIGSAARTELEKFFTSRVYLDLTVRVREGWRGDRTWLTRLGYGP